VRIARSSRRLEAVVAVSPLLSLSQKNSEYFRHSDCIRHSMRQRKTKKGSFRRPLHKDAEELPHRMQKKPWNSQPHRPSSKIPCRPLNRIGVVGQISGPCKTCPTARTTSAIATRAALQSAVQLLQEDLFIRFSPKHLSRPCVEQDLRRIKMSLEPSRSETPTFVSGSQPPPKGEGVHLARIRANRIHHN